MKTIAIILMLVGVLLVLGRRIGRIARRVSAKERSNFNQIEEYSLIAGVVLVLLGGILCFVV